MEENKKKEPVKQIQKNLKFSTEEERNELTTLLTNMQLEGATDGAKILNLVRSLMSSAEYDEVIEGADESLNAIYKAGLTELEILTKSIRDRYCMLMTTSNIAFEKSEAKNENFYSKKIQNLEKLIEKKEDDESRLKKEVELLKQSLSDNRRIAGEASERVNEVEKQLIDKEKIIEDLRFQNNQKDLELQALRKEKEQAMTEIKDERDDLKKSQQQVLKQIEHLRSENEQLKSSYSEVNKVNIQLTFELKQKDIKIDFSNKEIERLENDLNRVRSDRDLANAKVEQSLIATRELEENLRKQMLDVMNNLATQTKSPTIVEKEDGKDTVIPPQLTKTTFQVLDPKGKSLFKGNKNELVKYVNKVTAQKLTNKVGTEVIESLITPCTLKVTTK